ncbi:LAGLIDADG family homing endonuclease [Patescibacteria group bacterium]|nr:LAGLIDADG family homing endonuclease [Patescibacteria group bacterium]
MPKPLYKKVNKLKLAQAGYVAAFIDGEGSITLPRFKSNGKNHEYYRRLSITISNTELRPLREIMKMIGVGKITNKNPSSKNHLISYAYQINSQQALDVIIQIYPYLLTYKKERAGLVLKEYKKVTPRNGKYNKIILKKKEAFVKKFFSILPGNKARQKPKFI